MPLFHAVRGLIYYSCDIVGNSLEISAFAE
jgi:hypothetical protein